MRVVRGGKLLKVEHTEVSVPFYFKLYNISNVYKRTTKREVEHVVKIGLLRKAKRSL